jgi:hypothetical protein
MHVSTRLVLLCVLLGAIVSAPIVIGAFNIFHYAPVAVALSFSPLMLSALLVTDLRGTLRSS